MTKANPTAVARKWDALTVADRAALLRRDPSMRLPRWAGLVERLSATLFADLSPLQRDAVASLLR